MSVEAMALVLHHSKASGTAKLILVGIANHDGDGGAYPSIATLAKYGGVHPRNVKRALKTLVDLGEIRIDYQGGGDRHCEDYERPNLYHVLTRCPSDCDGSTKHKLSRRPGDATVTPRVTLASREGVTVASPKPPSEPSFESSGGHPDDDSGLPAGSPLRVDRENVRPRPARKARKLTPEKRQDCWQRFRVMDLGDLEPDMETRGAAFLELELDHGVVEPDRWAQSMIDRGQWDGFCASFGLGSTREATFTQAAA